MQGTAGANDGSGLSAYSFTICLAIQKSGGFNMARKTIFVSDLGALYLSVV
jgi:hypothetical protein